MASFYVYYRVAPAQQTAALAAVSRLFVELQSQTGVTGRLMHRADDATTWMEVYEGLDDTEAFGKILAKASEASGLPALLDDAKRVTECFVDIQDKDLRIA